MSHCNTQQLLRARINEPGSNPTKVVTLRLSLSLTGFPVAKREQYGVETSMSTFLIACDASYQKCAKRGFYTIRFLHHTVSMLLWG